MDRISRIYTSVDDLSQDFHIDSEEFKVGISPFQQYPGTRYVQIDLDKKMIYDIGLSDGSRISDFLEYRN